MFKKKYVISNIKKKSQIIYVCGHFVINCIMVLVLLVIIKEWAKRFGKDLQEKVSKASLYWYYESLYKEFSKHLKGHKVLKGNYLTVVKEIKRKIN